jgi:hypothetical protein
VSASTTITYPHPRHARRSALGVSGQHSCVNANFLTYSARTQRDQVRRTRLRRSQACYPNSCGPSNSTVLDTPMGYTKRASEPRFRRSEALSHTWWQVKDSNLRSFRDGFTVPRLQAGDQRKRPTRNNFHAYSPQIADVSRGQRDTPGRVHVPPWSLIGRLWSPHPWSTALNGGA